MTMDSVQYIREWGSALEQALKIPIVVNESGMLALTTKGRNAFSIEPTPGQLALTFTGILGQADDTMPASMLRTLLTFNLSPVITGTGCIAVLPNTNDILFRMDWRPAAESWTEQMFATALAAFAEHVDALAAAIATGELEQIQNAMTAQEPSGAAVSNLTGLV